MPPGSGAARNAGQVRHEARPAALNGSEQEGDARSIRRVRTAVAPEFAEKDRLPAVADRECLRHADVAGVEQVLGLEIHLELVRHTKRIAGRGERVEREKEEEEANAGARAAIMPAAWPSFSTELKNGVLTTFAVTR